MRACEEFERWDQAAEVYRRVAELSEPERVAALAVPAGCLGKAGRVAEAEAEFQRLQAEHPQDTQVLFQLAWFRQDQGEWLKAIELYRRIEELSIRIGSGGCRGSHRRRLPRLCEGFDQAQAAYEAALAAEPGRVSARRGLAWACEQFERWVQAAEVYRKVAELSEPERVAALARAGGVWGRPAAWLRPRPSSSGCRPSTRRIRRFFSN